MKEKASLDKQEKIKFCFYSWMLLKIILNMKLKILSQ